MGDYNPDVPYILGEEWVGIRNEAFQLTPAADVIEQGHTFTLAQGRAIQDARFYANTFDPHFASTQAYGAAVYPTGSEALSGPIQTVIIPVNNGVIVSGGGGMSVLGSSVADALSTPGKLGWIESIGALFPQQQVNLFFNTSAYAQQLLGKRILGVNLLYTLYTSVSTPNFAVAAGQGTLLQVFLDSAVASSQQYYGRPLGDDGAPAATRRVAFGETNPLWSPGASPSTLYEPLPWTMQQLQRFEQGATNGIWVRWTRPSTVALTGSGIVMFIGYCALEVIYCEEQRVAYGCTRFGNNSGNQLTRPYTYGANIIPMHTPITMASSPVLSPGQYTLVLSMMDEGDLFSARSGPSQTLNAVRQLYTITPHIGTEVLIPFPVYDHVGEVMSKTTTMILPQLSLHVTGTGAPAPEVHAYGTVIAAPVYGTVQALQGINANTLGANFNFTQVRFYARRFGLTTQSLTITSGASSASITPSAFDQLPAIIDGWKEITLRLGAAISMGNTGGNVTWTWSSTSELVGNRWEVLAVDAPALSGIPGNLLNTVPTAQQLDAATYLEPAGAGQFLTWKSPIVSGAAVADTSADAVLLFSQDPPTVSGVVITQGSQSVTGIGLACGVPQKSIVTGISYQQISWSAPAVTGSGFGYLEVQRFDTIDNAWSTIARSTSNAITTFFDYEARIGLQSSYRVRVVNALGFVGAWSVTGTGTITAPGVSGTHVDNSVLTFTSNYRQAGSTNAAYVEASSSALMTSVSFPETSRTQLQWMYGRDYQAAFRPLERGGESFGVTMLLNQTSVAGPIVRDAARTIRDLAWSQLPYICVRNELGDRWYANVQIPGVTLQHNRVIQLVQATITEITATPYPVNPAL
jgi:hypothetical protein